jgi:hypothetical protein
MYKYFGDIMTPTDPELEEELQKEAARHLRKLAEEKRETNPGQADILIGAAKKLEGKPDDVDPGGKPPKE